MSGHVYPAVAGVSVSLKIIATFLLVPPIDLLLLAILGVAVSYRMHNANVARAGRAIAAAALAGLLLLAMPIVTSALTIMLERTIPQPPPGAPPPAAIIVLGGDVARVAGPPERTDIGLLTLDRLRSAAALARASRLPVLTTGGVVVTGTPVAVLMAEVLTQEFGVPVRWIEDASVDTWENAARSAAMLKAEGVVSAYVVTQGWHMRRALIAFRQAGLIAVPAPTPLAAVPSVQFSDFVPRATEWAYSYYALYEWLGIVWYGLWAAM
jgi:uncharacterized SAM-binding protein YcdF (DUF218 family)